MKAEDAFSILYSIGHDTLEKLQANGVEFFGKSDFEGAHAVAEQAQNVSAIISELTNLHKRWKVYLPESVSLLNDALPLQKTPPGEITPQASLRLPILQALLEMGGKGETRLVIDRVGVLLQDILSDVDNQLLPSGKDIRWRNNCSWHRYAMIQDGLLKKDSKIGIWEISPEGIEYLKKRTEKRG